MAKTPKPEDAEYLTIDDPSGPQQVRVSHPGKLYFSGPTTLTKLDLVRYFLAIAPGALTGIADRPIVLKRFVNGANLEGAQPEPFYQKRAPDPASLPPFLRTVTLSFPSGRTAEELVVDTPAGLAWMVNLGCIELHPHPVRSADLDHPDQLRIDLDPNPGVPFDDVRRVALETHALLSELGLPSFPKTSGSRGIHINVPIHPRWSFTEVRRAALALARAVERRIPTLATSKWWKEERHGVFLDYNQNAKDRTTASAYSVRPLPDARVSAPLTWDELPSANPADFTVLTMPGRFASFGPALGDPHALIDAARAGLEPLLELAAQDESSGLADAPWPPHFAKGADEPARVAPSRARKSPAPTAKSFSDQIGEGFGAKRFRKRATQPSNPKSSPETSEPESSPVTSERESPPATSDPKHSPVTSEPGAPSQTASPSEMAVPKAPDTAASHASTAPSPPEKHGVTPATNSLAARESAPTAPPPPEGHGVTPATNSFAAREPASTAPPPPEGHGFSRAINSRAEGAPALPKAGVEPKAQRPNLPEAPARKAPARRTPKFPLLTIAQSPDRTAAEAGLSRWREAHPEAAAHLAPDDILTDRMRGSATIWYRIRVNLRHVPEALRPPQLTPDPDDDPTRHWRERKEQP